METEDAQYVQKLILGEHSAFKFLFMKYFPKMKYFISHFVKSDAVAEELSQDIFMKIWENREKLSKIQSFNSYIYRMSKNISLNYLEHKYLEDVYLESYQEETETSIESELYAREIELLEQLTIDQMPSQRKMVYVMSRKKGMKNEEIAAVLGISKKTVENHLNLALKEIRKVLTLFIVFFI
ncbi:MAG: RNA polymerase sigma-70 factor [Tannerellaceae bacterium]|jgi:RNA polymerase sigma-70 factor (ECF subfamily)|nr:RNA polymerase sigma-70 factor [Tannerellaceae bacterium]